MAYLPKTRKRVEAIQRGPDGSAFRRCEDCGVLVAIALADMHECEFGRRKKLKVSNGGEGNGKMLKFQDQPRSAFHFFMEEFVKTCEGENEVDVDRKAVEIWKNMADSGRQPYVNQAGRLNSAYVEALLKEENDMILVDDEADSAELENFQMEDGACDSYADSDDGSGLWSEISGSY